MNQLSLLHLDRSKPCKKCGVTKPLNDFYRQAAHRTGYHIWCKSCTREHGRQWKANNKDRIRAKYRKYDLKKSFGITVQQYDDRLEEQDGLCAICFEGCPTGRRLAVDHDHATGEIRGLLCARCNQGIGSFKDNPAKLQSAIEYLTTAGW